jgi:hypothetical protein
VQRFLASILRLLPSPKSGSGFVGYLLFVLAPVAGLLTFWGHMDLVTEKINWIEHALGQWWGYPVLWTLGLLLLLYAGYKQQSQQQTSIETATAEDGDSRPAQEVEKLTAALKDSEQEREGLQKENERLTDESDKARAEARAANEQLKTLNPQVRALRNQTQRLHEEKKQVEEQKGQLEEQYEEERARRNREGYRSELYKLIAEGESLIRNDESTEEMIQDWQKRLGTLLDMAWGGTAVIVFGRQVSQLIQQRRDVEPFEGGDNESNPRRERMEVSLSHLKGQTPYCRPEFDVEEYRKRISEQ